MTEHMLATVRGTPDVVVVQAENGTYWSAQGVKSAYGYMTHAHKKSEVTDLRPAFLVGA